MAMYRHLEEGTLCTHMSVVLSMHCFTMHATTRDLKIYVMTFTRNSLGKESLISLEVLRGLAPRCASPHQQPQHQAKAAFA